MPEKKIVMRGVTPVVGERISIAEIVKSVGLKDGDTLDYTTPMGLQIKLRLAKGAPTDIKLFEQGTMVAPRPDIPEIAHQFPDWLEHCYIETRWDFDHWPPQRLVTIVCPKK